MSPRGSGRTPAVGCGSLPIIMVCVRPLRTTSFLCFCSFLDVHWLFFYFSVSCLFLFLLSAYFLTIFILSSSPAHRYQPRTLVFAPPLHSESVGIIGPYLYFHATISFLILVRFSLLRSRSRSHVCPYGTTTALPPRVPLSNYLLCI